MSNPTRDVIDNLSGDVTVGKAMKVLTDAFRAAGLETPVRDAQLLVQHAASVTREACLTDPDILLSQAQRTKVQGCLARRLAREPVSRILGYRHFFGRKFDITPATLDPRPDTETVIDCVLAFAKTHGLTDAPLRIIDVGTGSGILLVTLLAELNKASGLGIDLSSKALGVAQKNADALGVGARARFLCSDGVEEVAGPFEILVSNPPYIASSVIDELAPEVRNFDPGLALDGGLDGLAFYRRLVPHTCRLIPDGLAVFEVGHDQSDVVVDMLKEHAKGHGPVQISVNKDLSGHRRCVALQTHY